MDCIIFKGIHQFKVFQSPLAHFDILCYIVFPMQSRVPAHIRALSGIILNDTKSVHQTPPPSERIETLLSSTKKPVASRHHDDWSRSGKFSHHQASYTGHH